MCTCFSDLAGGRTQWSVTHSSANVVVELICLLSVIAEAPSHFGTKVRTVAFVEDATLMKNKVFWSPNLSQLILDFCFEKASSTPCKKVQ
ncbi:hypothetical protein F2Q70_00034544 [Brassica cretica]|uniref:Uncharacterized protein n=1 Tax=Brassica cretica TaxID=69181 RepID=A0A8S9K0G2_BRACR|nr:hypothetical protein F2Q70_00034544 [Brassica cretica]